MKKLILIITLALSFYVEGMYQKKKSSLLQEFTNLQNKSAIDFYQQLNRSSPNQNIFFSPYSILTALCMAHEGARNDTAQEMEQVFPFLQEGNAIVRSINYMLHKKLQSQDKSCSFETTNMAWVEQSYTLLHEYIKILQDWYGCHVQNVDFKNASEEARVTINQWVAQYTKNKITEILPSGSTDELTRLILTNTIYFKGVWEKPFNLQQTCKDNFYISQDEKIEVPFMHITGDFKYCKMEYTNNFKYGKILQMQILELPYANDNLSMVLLLPINDNLNELENQLSSAMLDIQKHMRTTNVSVILPKFILKTDYCLNDALKNLGMPSAFDSEKADFSGINGKKDLYISLVQHQACIEINEEGTEATATTSIVMDLKSCRYTPTFHANKPFLFFIKEKDSGAILFMGKIVKPG
jgi:serpin B